MVQANAVTPLKSESFSLLVVDDNDLNRELIALQLKRRGYDVWEANCGQKALDLMENQNFDLILLDIMMPGMSGIEVLERIRKEHSLLNLPIIMVTANDLEDSIVDALQRGANDYLIKPLNLSVTFARIKTQLALRKLATLKDEFVRFASHDLKKPLIVTLDIVETLQKECNSGDRINDDTLELIDMIHKTGENMQKVIEGFLNTENLNNEEAKTQYHQTQINELIINTLSENASYAHKKTISLVSDLSKQLPKCEINHFQIAQVIDNLVGNALKFSPANTETVVRSFCKDNCVCVEVSDNGPGLSDDDMGKLFVQNAKLSNKPTGGESSTGIGLSMSKQLVELHNGKIGARNNPIQGATFWFSLPLRQNKY